MARVEGTKNRPPSTPITRNVLSGDGRDTWFTSARMSDTAFTVLKRSYNFDIAGWECKANNFNSMAIPSKAYRKRSTTALNFSPDRPVAILRDF